MNLNNICNKFNVSVNNKKKTTKFLNTKKSINLNKFLVRNNLVKISLNKGQVTSKLLFNMNKPKFKKIKIKILKNVDKYTFK
jgi:hypothetical protein